MRRTLIALCLALACLTSQQAHAVTATGGTVTNYTLGGTNWTAHIFRAAEFAAMAPMVQLYVATLRKHFGAGAETNRDVTETAVAAYFEGKRMAGTITAVETADAMALTRYFEILSRWNMTGETWTLPYDQMEDA